MITRDATVAAAISSHDSLIAEEMNVAEVRIDSVEDHLVHLSAQANFKTLGPRLGPATKVVAAEIAELPHEVISGLLDGGTYAVGKTEISAADIVVRREPREGLVVAAEGSLSVALDVSITPELAVEGVAREVVSSIQGLRRSLGLDVSDRVILTWHTESDDLVAAFTEHASLIAGEVLAASLERADEPQRSEVTINDQDLTVSLEKNG